MKKYYRIREYSPLWWALGTCGVGSVMAGLCFAAGLIETL